MTNIWGRLSAITRTAVLIAVPMFAVLNLAQIGLAIGGSPKHANSDYHDCLKACREVFKAERDACLSLSGDAKRQCMKDARENHKQCRAQCKASFHIGPHIALAGDDVSDMDDA